VHSDRRQLNKAIHFAGFREGGIVVFKDPNLIDARVRRTVPADRAKVHDGFRFSHEDGLDVAVAAIADPAAYVAYFSLKLNEGTKADALDTPTHAHPNDFFH